MQKRNKIYLGIAIGSTILLAAILATLYTISVSGSKTQNCNPNTATVPGKLVLAHYMVPYTSYGIDIQSYVKEMEMARSYGIDGFALNAGFDFAKYSNRLDALFSAAEQLNPIFQMVVSLDVDSFYQYAKTNESGNPLPGMYGYFNTYKDRKAYAKHYLTKNPIITTFGGDIIDWAAFKQNLQSPCYVYVNFYAPVSPSNAQAVDGIFSWLPQNTSIDTRIDTGLRDTARAAKKGFMAYVAGSFSSHLASKNIVYEQNIVNRWQTVIDNQPEAVQLVTWNDFTEATNFFDPVVNISASIPEHDLLLMNNKKSHRGFLEMSKYFIQKYKNGGDCAEVSIYKKGERIFIWYRTQSVNSTATQDLIGRPQLSPEQMPEVLHIYAYIQQSSTLMITSGDTTNTLKLEKAGWQSYEIPFSFGAQKVQLIRNGNVVIDVQPLLPIDATPKIYDYDFNVAMGILSN